MPPPPIALAPLQEAWALLLPPQPLYVVAVVSAYGSSSDACVGRAEEEYEQPPSLIEVE